MDTLYKPYTTNKLGMAARFAALVGAFAAMVMVAIFVFCRDSQVRTFDDNLNTATTVIRAQFQAAFQQRALIAEARKLTADEDDGSAKSDDASTDSDNGGEPSFITSYGQEDDQTASYNPETCLYVRLVDGSAREVAESPSLRANPAVEAALRSMRVAGSGLALGFAGGKTLPRLRVETTDLNQYRLQVAMSWQKDHDGLLLLTKWLIAIAVLLALLGGAGGYRVAAKLGEPIEDLLPQVDQAPIEQPVQEDAPVKRRSLQEERAAVEVTEPQPKVRTQPIVQQDDTEIQKVGRTPPDI